MRNPERITTMLQKLEVYWRKNPDLRLGQIIENAKDVGDSTPIFYIEDSVIEEGLDKLIKRGK
jgi:uncharacterized protein YihD (DUF1040 family)